MFDVFISSVNKRSRTSFAEYLYSALERRKIITFNGEDSLKQISSTDPSNKKAIQVSQIAIIILSKTYIDTPGCLDELANIMKMKDKRGQTVMVIFYDMDPEIVRSLKWTDGKIKTLVRAAKLPGWGVVDGEESDCIEKTVLRVSSKLQGLTPYFKESAETKLIGIEARVQELKLLLKVGTGDVHKVAISGMWGSGKSTLASSIYDEISHEFEGCCFVKNVRARSTTHGLKTLQEEILSNVLKVNVTLTSIEQGIHMMRNKLRKNSVLIVLDDVNHIEHLEKLAGSREWFGDGSRIIITIRKQVLVKGKRFLIHNVSMLDPKEAIELFSRCVFGNSKPAQGLEEVSRKMVSKFDGHPSALISLGTILRGKDMSVWMSILDRLEAIPADEILKRFKVRDDGLQTNDLLQFLLEGVGAVSP